MRVRLAIVALVAAMVIVPACNKPDVPTLLTWAQAGINADCMFGAGALAANVCTFGGDAIALAQAAYAKDPANGTTAVSSILTDAATKEPALAPYLAWMPMMKAANP